MVERFTWVVFAVFSCVVAVALAPPLLPRCTPEQSDKESASRPNAPDPSTSHGDAKQGKQIFRGQCAQCHFATSTIERAGPGLKGLFKLDKMPRTGWPPTEENVRKVIWQGFRNMKPFRTTITQKQLDDLIAYLSTL